MSLLSCFFDSLSSQWDTHTKLDAELLDFLLGKLNLYPGKSVLDVGTGTGVLLPSLNKRTQYAPIDALDLSSGMLSQARRKYGRHPNIRFIQADIENYTLKKQYDNIVLYSVFPHLQHPEETIERLVRENLSPGGRLLIAHSQGRASLNEIHRRKHGCVSQDMLLPIPEQSSRFQKIGLRVAEADESDLFYYLLFVSSASEFLRNSSKKV